MSVIRRILLMTTLAALVFSPALPSASAAPAYSQPTPSFGDGTDGNLNIPVSTTFNLSSDASNGRTCADGWQAAIANLTPTSAQLASGIPVGCLAIGDEIMLISLQGTTSNNVNVGNFEFLRIASIDNPNQTVTFTTAKTRFYGTGAANDSGIGTSSSSQHVVLVRVPNYDNVTVSGTLTAQSWNSSNGNSPDTPSYTTGTNGGVLVIRVAGDLVGSGTIQMNQGGFVGGRGGYVQSGFGVDNPPQRGESYGGHNGAGTSANLGAGGGGAAGSGGGRGGGASHQVAGTGGGTNAGAAGAVYGSIELNQLRLGSGGGGAGRCQSVSNGGHGGRGGGIIIIYASNFTFGGPITANGAAGGAGSFTGSVDCTSTRGGGGSGGSILLVGKTLQLTNTVTPAGGNTSGNGHVGGAGYVALFYTFSLDVTNASISPVPYTEQLNSPPTGANFVVQGTEDTETAFTEAMFQSSYSDPDGDPLFKVQIATLPANGTLKLNGSPVSAGQEILVENLGSLVFAPGTDFFGSTGFTYKPHDGVQFSEAAGTITLEIAGVQDAPTVVNLTVTTLEDNVYTFSAAVFEAGFSDADGDALVSIRLDTMPLFGSLEFNGAPATIGQVITAANIGNLVYLPIQDWSGSVGFEWNASDGTEFAAQPANLTITVDPVNDAPVAGEVNVTGTATGYTFKSADFTANYSDVENSGLNRVQIVTLPPSNEGILQISGTPISAGAVLEMGQISSLRFAPFAGFSGVSTFTWRAFDGTDWSVDAADVNVSITAANTPTSTPSPTPGTPTATATPTPHSGGQGGGDSSGSSGSGGNRTPTPTAQVFISGSSGGLDANAQATLNALSTQQAALAQTQQAQVATPAAGGVPLSLRVRIYVDDNNDKAFSFGEGVDGITVLVLDLNGQLVDQGVTQNGQILFELPLMVPGTGLMIEIPYLGRTTGITVDKSELSLTVDFPLPKPTYPNVIP